MWRVALSVQQQKVEGSRGSCESSPSGRKRVGKRVEGSLRPPLSACSCWRGGCCRVPGHGRPNRAVLDDVKTVKWRDQNVSRGSRTPFWGLIFGQPIKKKGIDPRTRRVLGAASTCQGPVCLAITERANGIKPTISLVANPIARKRTLISAEMNLLSRSREEKSVQLKRNHNKMWLNRQQVQMVQTLLVKKGSGHKGKREYCDGQEWSSLGRWEPQFGQVSGGRQMDKDLPTVYPRHRDARIDRTVSGLDARDRVEFAVVEGTRGAKLLEAVVDTFNSLREVLFCLCICAIS